MRLYLGSVAKAPSAHVYTNQNHRFVNKIIIFLTDDFVYLCLNVYRYRIGTYCMFKCKTNYTKSSLYLFKQKLLLFYLIFLFFNAKIFLHRYKLRLPAHNIA
jgi:hypothetical protein